MGTEDQKKRRLHVKQAIAAFSEYVRTYSDQEFYEEYPDVTIVKDMVYGLGMALWGKEEHRGPSGYERTVDKINEILNGRPV